MGKKAVLIGCNYTGTKAELKGCVNDVKKMHRCLIDRYGFSENDIKVLIDADDSYTQPTGRNIRGALSDLIKSAESGDFLFVHYSGHGTRLPAETGEDDDTGYDECIVPCDMNLITDDDFRELVDQVPQGCRITIVSDSCHSGGLIDECKEQIGESFKDESEVQGESGSTSGIRGFIQKTGDAIGSAFKRNDDGDDVDDLNINNRSLPLDIIVDILKQKTGKEDITVGNVRPILFDVFGEDSTPKVKKFMKVLFTCLQSGDGGEGGDGGDSGGGFFGKISELAQSFLKPKLESNADYGKPAMETEVGGKQDAYAGSKKKKLPENGILISGCQTDQTSADATPVKNDQAESYGALSHAIQKIVEESEGKITNREVVMKARDLMKKSGFKQRPGLYCEDKHVEAFFICD